MSEIHKLRGQLTNLLNLTFPHLGTYVDPKMPPPNAMQLKALRQIVVTGFIDSVAVRKDLLSSEAATSGQKAKSTRGIAYRTMWGDEDAFIHPNSVLYHGEPPAWVVYGELFKTSKIWLKSTWSILIRWYKLICECQLSVFFLTKHVLFERYHGYRTKLALKARKDDAHVRQTSGTSCAKIQRRKGSLHLLHCAVIWAQGMAAATS